MVSESVAFIPLIDFRVIMNDHHATRHIISCSLFSHSSLLNKLSTYSSPLSFVISRHLTAGVSDISVSAGICQEAVAATVIENPVVDISSAAVDQQSNQQLSAASVEDTEEVVASSSTADHQNGAGRGEPGPTAETGPTGLDFVDKEGPVGNAGATSPTGDSGALGSTGPGRQYEPCTSDATSPANVTFRDLHPTPKIKRTVKTGDGRRQAAAVLTSPSYRKALFDKTTAKCSQTPKKKKKQTCGEDKKRGRKPRVVGNDKRKTKLPRKTSTPCSANRKGIENTCVNCGYVYGDNDDPFIDDPWFQCGKCQRWCHESCGTASHTLFFLCKM